MESSQPLQLLPQGPYEFTKASIGHLRERAGLYVLYADGKCVTCGKAENLALSLRTLFADPDDCTKTHPPTHFEIEYCTSFELGKHWVNLRHKLQLLGIEPLCAS